MRSFPPALTVQHIFPGDVAVRTVLLPIHRAARQGRSGFHIKTLASNVDQLADSSTSWKEYRANSLAKPRSDANLRSTKQRISSTVGPHRRCPADSLSCRLAAFRHSLRLFLAIEHAEDSLGQRLQLILAGIDRHRRDPLQIPPQQRDQRSLSAPCRRSAEPRPPCPQAPPPSLRPLCRSGRPWPRRPPRPAGRRRRSVSPLPIRSRVPR